MHVVLRTPEDFTSGVARYMRRFRPGFNPPTVWRVDLPKASGTVIDVPVCPGISCTDISIRVGDGFELNSELTGIQKTVKITIALDGELAYAVDRTRRDYDTMYGHCSIGVYTGRIRSTIAARTAGVVSMLQIHYSFAEFDRFLESLKLTQPNPLINEVLSPSMQPFKFATVAGPEIVEQARVIKNDIATISATDPADVQRLAAMIVARTSLLERWPSRVVSPADLARVEHVRSIILESLDSNATIRELAHQVGINEFKLKCGYRQAFGTTVAADRIDARLTQAARLIRTTDAKLLSIAGDVGMPNPGDFSVAFRRRFGCTPGEYRNKDGVSIPAIRNTR